MEKNLKNISLKMENKTIKKLNKIEKICLVGAIVGVSSIFYVTGLDIYNQNKKNKITDYGATLLLSSCAVYLLSLRKRNELKNKKNYFYKI